MRITMKKDINIATDFCKAPAGRYRKNGDYTGEVFREDVLVPALLNDEYSEVCINLDGLDGVGSSFWDEVFGEMLRNHQVSYDILRKKMQLVCSDDVYLVPTIESIIKDAIRG